MRQKVIYKSNVSSRSDLLTLLSEACELEHGLACSYLYSAFTLKQSVSEGISETQVHHLRKWSAQIFFIASQEMLHLSQVWNLLTAIGGTPYYFRPNFPQGNKYYPFNLPLKTEPFGIEALKRFILYELPSEINDKEFVKKNFAFSSEDDYQYKTVGELYTIIRKGFQQLNEADLFIGDKNLQIGPDVIDFPEIVKVVDLNSALQAIDMITEQGEGTIKERINCHYGMFLQIEQQLKEMLIIDPFFIPSRNCISNPVAFLKGNYAAGDGELILNEHTQILADLFDDIYNLMLRVLQFVFSSTAKDESANKSLASYAIQIMVRILKPFGEVLTLLPAFPDSFSKRAGPCFGLTRHVPFPDNIQIVKKLILERHDHISKRLENLICIDHHSSQLVILPTHLADIRKVIY